MTWKSLSDVYSEQVIRDNNAATIEPPLKEWRSLSDVYTESARHNYINEASLTIAVSGGNSKTFNLADVYIKEIFQKAEFHSSSMADTIENWVKSGKWEGDDAWIITNFIIGEINNLNRDAPIDANFDLIKKDIDQLVSTKGSVTPFRSKALASETRNFNYLEMLSRPGLKPGLKVLKGAFIQNIYDFAFKKSNNVNVGPGEVAATLFTEAIVPTKGKGDFQVGNDVIEIKKQKGIVGLARPGEELLKYMTSHVDKKYIDSLRDPEVNALNNLIKNNRAIIQRAVKQLQGEEAKAEAAAAASGEAAAEQSDVKLKQKKFSEDRKKLLELLIELLKKQQFTSEEINSFITPSKTKLTSKEFSPLGDIKTIILKIQSYQDIKVAKTNSLFIDKAKNNSVLYSKFFKTYLDNTAIPNVPAITDIINKSTLNPLQKIGALAIVDYQIKEGFHYIILTGNDYTSIVIGPFIKDNPVQNIEMVFNSKYMSDINFNMSGGRDTGKFEMLLGPITATAAPATAAPATDSSENESADPNAPTTQTIAPVASDYNSDASYKNSPTV